MKVKNIDVSVEMQKVQEHLATQKELSSETVALFKMLISIITLLLNLFGANSKNSGKPPSQDPFRPKKQRVKTDKKPGAQKGHIGTTLEQVEEPDEIVKLKINRDKLAKDRTYKEAFFKCSLLKECEIFLLSN